MNYKEYLEKVKKELEFDNYFDLGGLVFEARAYAGISQAELAQRMNTKQSSIARAESGRTEPSISFLEKVAKAVDTKLVYPRFEFMSERDVFYQSPAFQISDYSNEIKTHSISISFDACTREGIESLLKC
ncbi:helix-turn-helix transcriptional regulator [bacterium]|nr:helix-turn-helix transcriptional regulator [bacterium]